MRENASQDDSLRAYLADRDVLCHGCGYNLRGLKAPLCPECGGPVRIPETVSPEYAARILREFARARGLRCRHCDRALAELEGSRCTGCGTVYALAGLAPAAPRTVPARDRTLFWLLALSMLGCLAAMVRAAALLDTGILAALDLLGALAGLIPAILTVVWAAVRSPSMGLEVRLPLVALAGAGVGMALFL